MSLRRLPLSLVAAMASLITAAWPPYAAAQPRPATPSSSRSTTTRTTQETTPGTSLTAHLAPTVAQRLLRSPDLDERIRGVRRLAGQRDYDAVQILLRAIEDNAALVADPRVRLEAIRALAPFATRDPVRRLLVGWMDDSASRARPTDGLAALAQDQAAMALAASSDARAIEQLVIMLMDGEAKGDRAAHALEAHPPRNIDALLAKRALETPSVIDLLGRLGDLRAIPALRKVLANADIDVQAAAAVALARLGDASGAKAARSWLERDGSSQALRLASARALTLARDPLAPRAIAIVLADPATRSEGLALATSAPTPQLTPTLAGLLSIAKPTERTLILMALARSGGPLGSRTLAGLLRSNPADHDAWFALAHCRDPGANAWIASSLAQPSTQRMAARAALVRRSVLGETPDGLEPALRALATSKEPADRDAGVFGLALSEEGEFAEWTRSNDPVVVAAACRASLALSSRARSTCAALLHENMSPDLVDGIASALIDDVSLERISTRVLLDWAERDLASATVFARRLGERDDDVFRSRITRLLHAGSPAMRGQVALGLGRSPKPSAVALLVDAFAFEPDAWVRRCIVRALSRLAGPQAEPCLKTASQLDPDDATRSLASVALARRRIDGPVRGDAILWLTLRQSPGPASTALASAVNVWLQDGLAISAVAAPDGALLIPAISPGEARISVATAPRTRQPPPP